MHLLLCDAKQSRVYVDAVYVRVVNLTASLYDQSTTLNRYEALENGKFFGLFAFLYILLVCFCHKFLINVYFISVRNPKPFLVSERFFQNVVNILFYY